MRSRTNGALWGIWGSPQQQKPDDFLSRENRPVCRKGTTRHCLPQSGFIFLHICFVRRRFVRTFNKDFAAI